MGFMITIGILTRTLHVLPEAFIAVFYTGLSVALITTGTRFIWYWWRNRHLLVWMIHSVYRGFHDGCCFPSHNVSESLPKETTASPITLSNRISQEMYRLHRLVPLAKRINEKSYNTTLPFPHRANQTYLITNCYKPRNKLLSLYQQHTVRQL